MISFPGPYTNERLDILRCKVKDAQDAYMHYAGTADEIQVEILREDQVLVKYLLPWKTRVQSMFLNVPTDNGTNESPKSPLSSAINPWKGFDKTVPGMWTRDKLYLCVPGIDSVPNRKVRNVLPEDICCTALHFTVLYCTVLYCTVLYCTVLY